MLNIIWAVTLLMQNAHAFEDDKIYTWISGAPDVIICKDAKVSIEFVKFGINYWQNKNIQNQKRKQNFSNY